MGRLARLLGIERKTRNETTVDDCTVDPGGGAQVTAELVTPPGEDCQALPGDTALIVEIDGAGRFVVGGFNDPKNPQEAGPGERQIYSRDENGDKIAYIFLKSDGTIQVNNGSGAFEMQAGGNVVINGVTIDTSGNITGAADIGASGTVTAPNGEFSTSLEAGGIELVGHGHVINSGSSSPGPTAGPGPSA